jgi:hypothetical protein
MQTSVKVLVPSGSIGAGARSQQPFERGRRERPDVIAVDGGSTDSGPHYLGSGQAKCSVGALRYELRQLMVARAELGIPLIVGSCGTCGSDAGVDLMRDLCREIAIELGQTVRVACIYSEQSAEAVKTALAQGRIASLQPPLSIDDALIERCSHIVAAMGVEPIIHALGQGVDIVLAGRATDTALMAAVPLMRGVHAGAAWHAGKILECGAHCTTKPMAGAVMATIDQTGFTVQALAEGARATPRTVLAHMLYENSNPHVLVEPGGTLEVEQARYESIDDRRVRVEGSTWTPADAYTVKLEGAAPAGHQALIMCLLRASRYKDRFDEWLGNLERRSRELIALQLKLERGDYHLQFRAIGRDATLGALESLPGSPAEIGVMAIVTSPTQERTRELLAILNSPMLHFPLPDDEELPTHCFPLSPASMNRGVVYEFVLNHVMTVSDPLSPFRFDYATFGEPQ